MNFKELLTGQISHDEFAALMVRTFVAKGLPAPSYDAKMFSLSLADEAGGGVMFLGNFYFDYCNTPRLRRKAMAATFVDMRLSGHAAQSTGKWDPAKLVPVIRDESYLWFCKAQMAASNITGDYRIQAIPVGDSLSASLALDSLTQTAQVTDEILTSMGMSFEDALVRATQNLRDMSPDKWHSVGPQAYLGAWDDWFDCSRILLPDLIYRLNLSGNPVALVPCRGVLLVTSDRSVAGQVAIFTAAKAIIEKNSRSVSAGLIVLIDGHWQNFVPTDPAVLQLQHDIHVRFEDELYAQQKGLLEGQMQALGKDVFIASHSAYEKNGKVFSVATWSEGVEAWLPKTDYLMFVKPIDADANDLVCVTWDIAWDYLSPWMLEVPDVLPRRFHVLEYPSAEILDGLRANQVVVGE